MMELGVSSTISVASVLDEAITLGMPVSTEFGINLWNLFLAPQGRRRKRREKKKPSWKAAPVGTERDICGKFYVPYHCPAIL